MWTLTEKLDSDKLNCEESTIIIWAGSSGPADNSKTLGTGTVCKSDHSALPAPSSYNHCHHRDEDILLVESSSVSENWLDGTTRFMTFVVVLYYIFLPNSPSMGLLFLNICINSDVAQVIDCTSVRRSKHVLPVILLLITMNKWLPCTILCLKDDSQKCDWLFKYNFIVWQDRKTEISCGWIHFCLMQVSVCRNF